MGSDGSEDPPPYRVYRSGEPTEPPGDVRPPRGRDEVPSPEARRPESRAGGADEPPGYRVYRSRRGRLGRLIPESGLRGLRPGRRRGEPREPGGAERRGRRITPGRVAKWAALAVGGWLLLSFVIFLVSATLAPKVSGRAEDQLAGGSSLLAGSTVLVLGSDKRSEGTREPGAGGPARADSILLVHAGFGSVRRLSILRDTFAEIPGSAPQKINAAYAIGGPALMVETVEGFMGNGLEINHVVEVSFDDFPKLIDSLGGVDVTTPTCVRSEPFGGYRVKLKKGTHRLNGKQALRFARVRKNQCAPNEDDRQRAGRQQEVLKGIRSRFLSPSILLRLPLVSWRAPRTIRSDMAGPGLLALFTDLVTGGSGGKTRVLLPSRINGDGSLAVERDARRTEVARLVGKD